MQALKNRFFIPSSKIRQSRTHKLLSLACLLASMSLIYLSGCKSLKNHGKAESQTDLLRPVVVTSLKRTDVSEILNYVADLKPATEVKVYSPMMDRIIYFPWQDGDTVKRGQRIAMVRSDGLGKGLEQLAAQMDGLDVQIKNLADEARRSKALLSKGVITQSQYDKVTSGLQATQAQRRALNASRGQLAITKSNSVVTASISGVISNKSLNKGDMASPQIPLCQIMDISHLKAVLAITEDDAPKIRLEQKVSFSLDAFPGEIFAGKISTIMPYLDPMTRTNQVEVDLDNPKNEAGDYKLKPGMFGHAKIIVSHRDDVLVVPEQALLLDDRLLAQQKPGQMLRKAFVFKDNKVSQRLVELGARKGSLLEVLKGLQTGQQIVIRGQHGLRDGQKVRLAADSK